MVYVISPVEVTAEGGNADWLPGSFDTLGGSVWIYRGGTDTDRVLFGWASSDSTPNISWVLNAAPAMNIGWTTTDGNFSPTAGWTIPAAVAGQWDNFVFTLDSTDGSGEAWHNGVSLGAPDLLGFGPGNFGDDGSGGGASTVGEFAFCQADFSIGAASANASQFISGDGFPLDLGNDGTNTGFTPTVYCSVRPGGIPTDYLTNRGSAGGLFTAFLGIIFACAEAPPIPPPPPPPPITPKRAQPFTIYPGSNMVRNAGDFYVGSCCTPGSIVQFAKQKYPTSAGTR